MEYCNQIIEGLPSSYDVSYIIKNKKKCGVCNVVITIEDINERKIIYGEYYDSIDFCHKNCLEFKGFGFIHKKENDVNSPIKIVKISEISQEKPKRQPKREKKVGFSKIRN